MANINEAYVDEKSSAPPSYDQGPYPGAGQGGYPAPQYPGAGQGGYSTPQYPGAGQGGYPAQPYPVVAQQPATHTVIVQQPQQPADTGTATACLIFSIVNCLCCLWPVGLIAICVSAAGLSAARSGQRESASCYMIASSILNAIAFVGGIILIALYFSGTILAGSDDYDDY